MRSPLATAVRRPGDPAVDRGTQEAALAAVIALAAAEILVAIGGALSGAVVHGVLLLALLWGWVSAGDRTLLVLALVPLGRVTSLALTPDDAGVWVYALTGLPLLLAVGWMVRDLRLLHARTWRRPAWHTVPVALSGVPLGWAVHTLLDLPRAGGLPTAVAALVVFLFAGALEELLYRGLVQRVLTGMFGTAGVVLADLLFAAAYLPTGDDGLLLVMAVLGLGAGFYVWRTGGLAAVAVAHGLLAAGALVVWPVWT
jgi:membrane protease YdiL (CAAX protease family)